MSNPIQLRRDAFGKLVFTNAEGEEFVGVIPVRAFPIQAPTRGISLATTRMIGRSWSSRGMARRSISSRVRRRCCCLA